MSSSFNGITYAYKQSDEYNRLCILNGKELLQLLQ